MRFDASEWALILGGSSGFGLAAAHELSRRGLSVAVVHRDRRGAMARIQPAFDAIADRGVGFAAFNVDALSVEGREEILAGLGEALGARGRVRVLLHSIAFGNLRLIAPEVKGRSHPSEALARALALPQAEVREAANRLLAGGETGLCELADPPGYDQEALLDEEDFARTVHAMGTSLVAWVQALRTRQIFAADARVLALTSEGNRAAWRGYAAVSAAKAALEACVRSIALECAPHGIRANAIQAGVSDTPALRMIPGHRSLIAHALRRNPFGRLTTPEDVARFIALMCSDEAAWVNGTVLVADGGEHLG